MKIINNLYEVLNYRLFYKYVCKSEWYVCECDLVSKYVTLMHNVGDLAGMQLYLCIYVLTLQTSYNYQYMIIYYFSFIVIFFRQHLETREQAEVQKQAIERKHEELISQLNSILSIDSSYRMTTEDSLRKVGKEYACNSQS